MLLYAQAFFLLGGPNMRKLLLFLVVFLALTCNVLAAKTIAADRVIVNTIENDNLALAGGDISVSSKVNGDLLCAGGRITVDGPVQNDISCVGGDISINKEVEGEVRVAGGNVVVGARINGDLVVIGGTITVKDSAVVVKDVMILGGNVIFRGTAMHNIDIRGGNIIYGGTSGNNLFIDAGKITFESGAHAVGNFTYRSKSDVDISKIDVRGMIFKRVSPTMTRSQVLKMYAYGRLMAYLALLIIGLLMLLLLPKYAEAVAKTISRHFWKSLGYGLLFLVIMPILIILAMLTIIGIPLALIALAVYILLIYTGKLAVAFWAAETVVRKNRLLKALAFLIALLAAYLLASIPYIGWIIAVIITVMGIGAMVMAAVWLIRNPQQKRAK